MADKPIVEINRTCLSLLLRDNAKSPSDQEGFLIGEVIERAKNISDTQERAGTTVVIRVIATIPLARHCTFYNGVGKVNHDALKQILGPYADNLVGYYDFKRNMEPVFENCVTFTQKNVYKGLCDFKNISPESPFVFMMLRQKHDISNYDTKMKHIIVNSYSFLNFCNDGSFQKLASSIPNLGDTSHDRYVQNPPVPQVDKLFDRMKAPSANIDALPVVKIHKTFAVEMEKKAAESTELEHKYNLASQKLAEAADELASTKALSREMFEVKEAQELPASPVPSTSAACQVRQSFAFGEGLHPKVTLRRKKTSN